MDNQKAKSEIVSSLLDRVRQNVSRYVLYTECAEEQEEIVRQLFLEDANGSEPPEEPVGDTLYEDRYDKWYVVADALRGELVTRRGLDADLGLRLGNGETLTVTCGQSTFKLLGLPKDNFPAIPTPPWCASPGATQNGASQKKAPRPIPLPGSVLRTLIQRTIFAITQDESRYTLSGALAIFEPKALTMVSTDGRRLSVVSKAMALEDLTEEVRVLIPPKALSELLKLTTDDVSVAFGKDENQLFFQVGARLLISRILAGQFPNYELVILKDNDTVVGFDTTPLTHALRRAQVLADERSHAIKLVLDKEQAEVIANSSDAGEARNDAL